MMLKRSHSIALISVASFTLTYLFLITFNTGMRSQNSASKVQTVSSVSTVPTDQKPDAAEKAAVLLDETKRLERQGLYQEAESNYKKILLDQNIFEAHDPLRILVLESYANLLVKLRRPQEAHLMFQRAKQIPVRRKIDRHPDKAHIS